MADRIVSDHPSIETKRATVSRHGGSGRRLELPAGTVDSDRAVRVWLEGSLRYGRVARRFSESGCSVTGVFGSPTEANEGSGEDLLDAWLTREGIGIGQSVLFDIVEPDYEYGLRTPGETVYYEPSEPPKQSLRDIASQLESRD